MRLPCCICGFTAASSLVIVTGPGYGGQSVQWFCVNKECQRYGKQIDPTWLSVEVNCPECEKKGRAYQLVLAGDGHYGCGRCGYYPK